MAFLRVGLQAGIVFPPVTISNGGGRGPAAVESSAMPEDFPGFSVDTDWKKQAQEEKRRLAEEAERQKAAAPAAIGSAAAGAAISPASATQPPGRAGARSRRARREEMPEANFVTLVQTLASQALVYLGGVATAAGEAIIDLDTAKHQIDLMAMLEDKTRGSLTPDEQKALDVALYETRMRYVGVASRYIL
jgi:hypothetical protein